MACGSDWLVQSANIVWILTLLLSESQSKKTQVYYMEAKDCGNRKALGGAVVYSHSPTNGDYYRHNIECHITFQAEYEHWKLMLRMQEMDIPDKTENGYCNDAVYVYDAKNTYAKGMAGAGGTGGLCGQNLPETLTSTGQYMTVVFKTDSDGRTGRGFKFIITAFSDDHKDQGSCGSNSFLCDNQLCIDEGLVCDGVDSCGDYSDEAASGNARCKEECGFICQFLSLGITASIFISVASIVIIISCFVALVCCCRRSFCQKSTDPTTYTGNNVVTTATTVSVNGGGSHHGGGVGGSVGLPGSANGGSVSSYQASRAPSAFSNHGYSHQGYYPMQPVVYPSPHHHPHAVGSSVYSYAKESPFIAPPCSQYSSQYSSHHSSHPPSNHTRSYTPTSSKSGKSNRSNNSTSVTYSQGTEKVSLPVKL